MKLVFLDASTLGETSLADLYNVGELVLYPTTSPCQVYERVKDADVIITNKVVLDRKLMERCEQLKLICVAATGMNCIDLAAADEFGVPVRNVAGYSTMSVCQHTIGMMINLTSSIANYADGISSWAESPIFTQLHLPIQDLAGKTLGIVGLGSIGKQVAVVAEALGMKVVSLARTAEQIGQPGRLEEEDFFSTSDIISLHCPLTPESKDLICARTLDLMKSSAFLINTGRGDLVNEADLAAALEKGAIAGAGLDVLTQEPPAKDHVLLQLEHPSLMITPHTAWASEEARERLVAGVVQNIRDHFETSNG